MLVTSQGGDAGVSIATHSTNDSRQETDTHPWEWCEEHNLGKYMGGEKDVSE